MKLATKIAAGYATLIVLIVGVLAYHLSLFNQMQAINQQLSGINFRAAILSLQLLRDLEQVEEFTRKYYATGGDPDYASQMMEMREAFSQELKELESLPLSASERQEMNRLKSLWAELPSQEEASRSMSLPEAETALSNQLTLFSRLGVQGQALIRATRLAIQSQVEESSRDARRAQRTAWIAALTALSLSLMVCIWILRSVSEPLRSLTEGTRAVAEGKFFYQLDATGKDELAQLARDFNVMTQRLSELDEMKKGFVSHVSHELKTPLASIHETMRLLLDEIPGPLNEQQRRFLELSLQSSRRLSALIGNLLDLSRMEAGVMQYEIKKHDLGTLVRVVLAECEPQLREKNLQLEVQLPEEPVTVHCDGDRIIQVVGNLVGNAMKFSPRDGVLSVSLTHESKLPDRVPTSRREQFVPGRDAGFALLSVADRGPGIPPAERERIFEKFHQTNVGRKAAGQGAGLGLSIGRTIVEAHRGAIWVEGNPEEGSTFYLLLRAGAVAEPATIQTSSPI